jgi:hypothetical protein
MKTSPQFTISRDRNGNKTVKVKAGAFRTFTIQTLGNLPATHRLGVGDHTRGEVSQFVASFGTDNQRRALAAFGL